jgi:hypothetical protein
MSSPGLSRSPGVGTVSDLTRADLQVVDGVPDVYIAASHKVTRESEWEVWEGGVRGLYKQMVIITITPTWGKLLDFETTLPTAVEELSPKPARQRRRCAAPTASGSRWVAIDAVTACRAVQHSP